MQKGFTPLRAALRRGFTLIELLLVIGVISIISGVVIVAIAPRKNFISARDAERKHSSKQLQQAIYAHLVDNWEMATGIPEGEGNAKPICKAEYTGGDCPGGAVPLNMLPPAYISSLPVDVVIPETEKCTGYMVYHDVGRPKVYSANLGKLEGDTPEGGCSGGFEISSDIPLAYVEHTDNILPLTESPNATIDISGAPVDASSAPVDASSAPVDASSAPVSGLLAFFDTTQAATATITLDAPSASSCSVLNPFDSISCSPPSFGFQTDSITETADFRINTPEHGNSNTIPARKWTMEKLTDRSGIVIQTKMTLFNNELYFRLYDSGDKEKLYKTDGTSITQVSNTNPGGDDNPTKLIVHNGSLYFRANDSSSRAKLFRTDGTNVTQVSNINPGGGDGIAGLFSFGSDLYFQAYGDMYKTDGATVTLISDTNPGGEDYVYPNLIFGAELYFYSHNSSGFAKLYKTDGSSVTQVSNTNPSGHDHPGVIEAGGTLYLKARNLSGNYKLYKVNGTTITQISDINPGGDDAPGQIKEFGNTLFFSARDSSGNYKLYKTDGATVTRISDTNPGGNDYVTSLTPLNGSLHFMAFDSSNSFRLYETDGTTVTLVSNIGDLIHIKTTGASLYLTAGNNKLHMADENNVLQLSNLDPSDTDHDDVIDNIMEYKSAIYFEAWDNGSDTNLFRLSAQ